MVLSKATVLIAVAALAAVLSASGQTPESAGERTQAQHSESLPNPHRHIARGRDTSLGKFMDSNGIPTITNRADKYRSRADYTEVAIDFEPISVPREYRRYTSPTEYTDESIGALVRNYARQYMLDESLIYAVIRAESNFNPKARSHAGACGLMQLMPATAAEMGVTDIFDPAQNIAGGTQYLSKMLGLFNNDLNLALAAYNAGPEAVRRHGGIPPYRETQGYVRTVLRFQRMYKVGGAPARAELARGVRTTPSQPAASPIVQRTGTRYMVHFHSGLKQPADEVVDEAPYYFIVHNKRTYPVRQELVERIEEAA